MDETFLLSNIAPQVGVGFNRHCMYSSIQTENVITPPRVSHTDWAYLESWCRHLTNSFADVYVFTIPLYLPRQDADGKWRVVSPLHLGTTTLLLSHILLLLRNHVPDSRGDRVTTQHCSANTFRKSRTRLETSLSSDSRRC